MRAKSTHSLPGCLLAGINFARDTKDRRIMVTVSIEQRVRDQIRADSVATIGTIGLVGDKVLEITVGSADKPVLELSCTPGVCLCRRNRISMANVRILWTQGFHT